MEKQEMKITPQDIIDKEFRVKFRGFDMAEVDTFLEEVAENLFKLTEENTVLNEKILALQQDLEAAGSLVPQGQMELPVELENSLEELKQDIAAIGADLASLKQDRPSFEPLENTIRAAVASMQEAAGTVVPQGQIELPVELGNSLEGLKENIAAIGADLASLKQDRPSFEPLENTIRAAVASMQEAAGTVVPQGQLGLPVELGNGLEGLKENIAAIGADLASLKQDRPSFEPLENTIRAAVASIQEAIGGMKPQDQLDSPPDLLASLDKFKQDAQTFSAEMNALKEDRQAFDALKKSLEQVVSSAREAASSVAPRPQGQVEPGADLTKPLEDFKQGTETIRSELAGLKEELVTISGMREDLINEVRELFSSQLKDLEAKLSQIGAGTAAAPPSKKEKLLTAEIIEEEEGTEEDRDVQDYQEEEDDFEDDEALEFLNEDDILDVDKLRNVFQSVLDDDVGNGHESREGDDDVTADLLFFDDDLLEDEPEPKVSFADEKDAGQ